MSKFKDIFWGVLAFIIVGYFIYKIGKNMLSNNIKSNNSIHVKAIIIDERNYMGNQNVKPQFSYSYEFIVNGEKYTGNSHDTTLKVGDTIAVEYDKNQPSISRPINAKN